MEQSIRDLSDIYGHARLYATLKQTEKTDGKALGKVMYKWYCSNIDAFNECHKADLVPLEPEIFYYKLVTAHVSPYMTEVQTIKALELLNDNIEGSKSISEILELDDIYLRHINAFKDKHGCYVTDGITSYSLCENSLDPDYEPESELNPAAFLRKYEEGPKLVYICTPLRGNVEKNIEFAKSKAKAVFADGNIPICPHLMFTPIADPGNPAEDKAAMQMCMKLIDRCNEIHVYGSEWTDGMWQEIHHAERMKIPVLTDQERVPKARYVQQNDFKKKSPCR